MKRKKGFSTLVMAGLLVLFLCLPGTVLGKGPNPPVVGADEKLIGRMLHGVLIAGWAYMYTEEDSGDYGTVEAFLQLRDKVYGKIIQTGVPEDRPYEGFLQMTAADIPNFSLPEQIVLDFNMGDPGLGARAVIFEEKDVLDFAFIADERFDVGMTYRHVLHCRVTVSFIVPRK